MWETWVQFLSWEDSLGWKDPWRKEKLSISVFWPGEFHGQRSLMGYSPWGSKELDSTERLKLLFSLVNNVARTFSQDLNPGLSDSKIYTFFNIMQSSPECMRKRVVLHNYIINKSYSRQFLQNARFILDL